MVNVFFPPSLTRSLRFFLFLLRSPPFLHTLPSHSVSPLVFLAVSLFPPLLLLQARLFC